jgi:hypothetical protein
VSSLAQSPVCWARARPMWLMVSAASIRWVPARRGPGRHPRAARGRLGRSPAGTSSRSPRAPRSCR